MNAADQVLLRLADPAARPALLTSDALLQLATVSYAIDPATVTGPTTAAYDRVELAVPLPADTTATARMMRAGDAMPWDVVATWDSGRDPTPAADAVVVARLAVRTGRAGGTIDQVDLAEPAQVGDRERLGMVLTMSAPPDPVTAPPLVLPVVVAVLVADPAASPRDLLRATAVARRAALAYPLPEPPTDAPPRRTERCVCWLMPATAFDDDGWPGASGGNADAKRAARLAAARAWLASTGVAVVTT